METKLYRVYLNVEYIVPENQIGNAEDWLCEDVMNLVKYNEVESAIAFEPAPNATLDQVHEAFLEDEEE